MVKDSVEGSVLQTIRNCVANFVLNWLSLKLSLIETSPWNLRYPRVGTDARFLCQVQQPFLTLSTDLIIFCFFFQIGIPCIGFLLWIITSRHFIIIINFRTSNSEYCLTFLNYQLWLYIRKWLHCIDYCCIKNIVIYLVVSSMAFSFINFRLDLFFTLMW